MSDNPPIRALLLDKDGTLIDFERSWGPAVHAVLQDLADGDHALYRLLADSSGLIEADHRFRPDSPIIGEPTDAFGARWAQLLGRKADPAFFAELDRMLCAATTRHLAPIGDPRAVLADLGARGYRLGMMTNDSEAAARAHARKLGVEDLLGFIAGYDSGFGAKPDAEPVLAFAAAIGVDPACVAVVGDTPLDVAAARAAGSLAIVVLTGPMAAAVKTLGADAVIESIADLGAWLDLRQPSALAM